jgi:P pilus assembly chaperone PapD
MRLNARISYILILVCCFYSLVASAGITPFPMVLRFKSGEIRQDFEVKNNDTEKVAYVDISVRAYKPPNNRPPSDAKADGKADTPSAEVNTSASPGHPADTNAKKAPQTPLTPQQSGLLVSPTKLVLPPGAKRLIRVQLLQPPGAVERRYTILVKPVEGDPISLKSSRDDVRAAVRVVVAYGVVVIIPPASAN